MIAPPADKFRGFELRETVTSNPIGGAEWAKTEKLFRSKVSPAILVIVRGQIGRTGGGGRIV